MKVGHTSQVVAHNLELKKLDQQLRLKQHELQVLDKRRQDLEKIKSQDPDKGQIINLKT